MEGDCGVGCQEKVRKLEDITECLQIHGHPDKVLREVGGGGSLPEITRKYGI